MFSKATLRSFKTSAMLKNSHASPSLAKMTNIVYRLANKKDKEALTNLMSKYVMQDEHYKGLQGSVEETEERCDYMVRDALRFPYTMMAYDNDQPIGFSLITNRFRDVTKNRLELLGPFPEKSTTNFSYLCNIRDHAENHFWSLIPQAQNIFINEALFVEPNYRRLQIASTLVDEQFQRIGRLTKDEWSMDGMITLATSYAHLCQLEKLGFIAIYDIPQSYYRRANGQMWKSADEMMPYARLMYLKY